MVYLSSSQSWLASTFYSQLYIDCKFDGQLSGGNAPIKFQVMSLENGWHLCVYQAHEDMKVLVQLFWREVEYVSQLRLKYHVCMHLRALQICCFKTVL